MFRVPTRQAAGTSPAALARVRSRRPLACGPLSPRSLRPSDVLSMRLRPSRSAGAASLAVCSRPSGCSPSRTTENACSPTPR